MADLTVLSSGDPSTDVSASESADAKRGMIGFQCDTFALQIQFEAGDLDVEAFLKAVSGLGLDATRDEDGDIEFASVFRNTPQSAEYHAHLNVRVWKSGKGAADLSYYSKGSQNGIEPPPSVDDCSRWFGEFLARNLEAHVHINYTFDQSFTPTVGLNFPLTTPEKSLAGAVVSGLALILPTAPNTTVIIQSNEDNETYLFLRETAEIDLKTFNLVTELARRTDLVNRLVKKSINETS